MDSLKKFQFCLLLTLLLINSLSSAQDLLIFPKRVVFEGVGKRSETINLTNTGKDTAQYDISFVQIRMKENGGFENIKEPDSGQFFASGHLRYFPRKVVLAPNETQVVKVQIASGKKLEPGEYRSHLYFRAVPATGPLGEETEKKETETSSMSIRLTPIYGITIPVIIRTGDSDVQVNISGLAFEMADNNQPMLIMDFNRSGDISVYGDIEVTYTSKNGKKTKVAEVGGFAVYTPGTLRKAKIALNKAQEIDYGSGKLSIAYFTGNKKTKLAEAEMDLTFASMQKRNSDN